MPLSFIFDMYAANFDFRRPAALTLKLLWCLFAVVFVVVFVSFFLLMFVLVSIQVVDLDLPIILLTLHIRYSNVHNKGQIFGYFIGSS